MAYGETYEEFVEKFKAKKTTDDCYTPPEIYDAVADWVAKEYGVDRGKFVRPFYPGGDFENYDYSGGAIVVDNPPFSILKRIKDFYCKNDIPFFLFAPHLTLFASRDELITYIVCDNQIIYENGAKVRTSFVTNMDDAKILIRTAPTLTKSLKAATQKAKASTKKTLPKYVYPPELLTVSMLASIARAGIDYRIERKNCIFTRQLDEQKQYNKHVFGGGT